MELFLFIFINTFAGFFQGIIGFGQGLIAIPLSLTFLDKKTVLTAMMIMGSFLNFILTTQIKEALDKRKLAPLLISSVIGMPLGLFILIIMPLNTMKIIAGTSSILFTFMILSVRIKLENNKLMTPIAGLVSGILQTSIGMPGPPVVILLTGSNTSKHLMRKTLAIYFLFISVISIPLFITSGVFSIQGFLYGISALPFIYLAGHFGNKIAQTVPQKVHKIVALATVIAAGTFAIQSGLQ